MYTIVPTKNTVYRWYEESKHGCALNHRRLAQHDKRRRSLHINIETRLFGSKNGLGKLRIKKISTKLDFVSHFTANVLSRAVK